MVEKNYPKSQLQGTPKFDQAEPDKLSLTLVNGKLQVFQYVLSWPLD